MYLPAQYSSHLMSSKPSFMSTFLGESETQPFSKVTLVVKEERELVILFKSILKLLNDASRDKKCKD